MFLDSGMYDFEWIFRLRRWPQIQLLRNFLNHGVGWRAYRPLASNPLRPCFQDPHMNRLSWIMLGRLCLQRGATRPSGAAWLLF
jgi:hypothetical protein